MDVYASGPTVDQSQTVDTIISLFNIFDSDSVLQPPAVAFLAGYGVEAFFAFLDALLVAFSNRGRSSPAHPTATA